jgi:hypothetical protein
MATLSIVKHLDVLKQISSGFVWIAIADPDDAFTLEDSEEAFDEGMS